MHTHSGIIYIYIYTHRSNSGTVLKTSKSYERPVWRFVRRDPRRLDSEDGCLGVCRKIGRKPLFLAVQNKCFPVAFFFKPILGNPISFCWLYRYGSSPIQKREGLLLRNPKRHPCFQKTWRPVQQTNFPDPSGLFWSKGPEHSRARLLQLGRLVEGQDWLHSVLV